MHRISDVSAKRERELARAKFERQKAKRAARKQRAKFFWVTTLGLTVIGLTAYFLIPSNEAEIAQPTASQPVAADPVTPRSPIVDGCVDAVIPRANNITYPSQPQEITASSEIVFATNCGDLVVKTDPNAPNTVGILSFFAENKFYDGIKCHRLTTEGIFVLQCGDPAGNGSGGPGFEFADENLPTADSSGIAIYPRGTVAMANSGPNSNGSQFFLVYQDSPLPPNYTIWGQLLSGLERLDTIASAGTLTGTTDGPPAQEIVISTATIKP
jgi:peptidyl-prolyl cis-trans isomerase B (cyclophilin B)